MSPNLSGWQNFYVIVGAAAGALIGLQFIVITLIAQSRRVGSRREIRAFGSPTVVHFCASLLICALMAAPWQSKSALCACLVAAGILGMAYSFRTLRHAQRADYQPDLEDWIWYVVVPIAAHTAAAAGGVWLWIDMRRGAAAIAVDALLFLLAGIHNSWDTVTYIAVQRGKSGAEE